jgi:hypothetical protein
MIFGKIKTDLKAFFGKAYIIYIYKNKKAIDIKI